MNVSNDHEYQEEISFPEDNCEVEIERKPSLKFETFIFLYCLVGIGWMSLSISFNSRLNAGRKQSLKNFIQFNNSFRVDTWENATQSLISRANESIAVFWYSGFDHYSYANISLYPHMAAESKYGAELVQLNDPFNYYYFHYLQILNKSQPSSCCTQISLTLVASRGYYLYYSPYIFHNETVLCYNYTNSQQFCRTTLQVTFSPSTNYQLLLFLNSTQYLPINLLYLYYGNITTKQQRINHTFEYSGLKFYCLNIYPSCSTNSTVFTCFTDESKFYNFYGCPDAYSDYYITNDQMQKQYDILAQKSDSSFFHIFHALDICFSLLFAFLFLYVKQKSALLKKYMHVIIFVWGFSQFTLKAMIIWTTALQIDNINQIFYLFVQRVDFGKHLNRRYYIDLLMVILHCIVYLILLGFTSIVIINECRNKCKEQIVLKKDGSVEREVMEESREEANKTHQQMNEHE